MNRVRLDLTEAQAVETFHAIRAQLEWEDLELHRAQVLDRVLRQLAPIVIAKNKRKVQA